MKLYSARACFNTEVTIHDVNFTLRSRRKCFRYIMHQKAARSAEAILFLILFMQRASWPDINQSLLENLIHKCLKLISLTKNTGSSSHSELTDLKTQKQTGSIT